MGNDELSPSFIEKLYTSLIKSRENLFGLKIIFHKPPSLICNLFDFGLFAMPKMASFSAFKLVRVVAETPAASDKIAPYQGNNYDGFMFLGVVVHLFRFII